MGGIVYMAPGLMGTDGNAIPAAYAKIGVYTQFFP
jgi:hypothetical protein